MIGVCGFAEVLCFRGRVNPPSSVPADVTFLSVLDDAKSAVLDLGIPILLEVGSPWNAEGV